MASFDSLPADQRAVLRLVLEQGRGYDEIARLLSVDRAGVRERALAAFDALGPGTRVPSERRALITDYMLGQLPDRVASDTRNRLAQSAGERAWARVIASELGPIANEPMPEIPVDSGAAEAEAEPAAGRSASRRAPAHEPAPATESGGRPPGPGRRSSRAGGAILLAGGALVVVIVVVVIVLVAGGSSSKHTTTSGASANASSTSATQTTASATPVATITLKSPSGSSASGVAVVIKQGTNTGIVIRGQGLPANTSHNAYAVWLSNSQADSHMLGFVNPGVKSDGTLQTLGVLPADAARFGQLLVTLETQGKPRTPGTVVLQGPFKAS
jgi:Anti-sigma-K factor rskA/Sigma-70, region 4